MSKDAAEIELLIESIDEVLVSGTEDDNSPNSLAGLSIDQLLERCKFPEPPFGTCAHLEGFSEQSSMVMSDIVSEVAPEITQDITTPDGTQFYKPKKANGNETFHIAINTSSNEYVDSNNNEELKIECYYLSDVSRSPPAKKASMEHSAEYSNDATITSADIPFNKKLFSTIVRPRPRKPNLEQKEINRHTKIYIDNDCLLLLSI
ncbi:hypothetical protein GGI25_001404 [Coemansia spiralis]|uniref:Uncharacterized protein n=2 Tax=Coemansia TaxID=4863 RepID=A0A9W8GAK6_9FUNG|nr:hypothetical protein EDC05_001369 [Coemansia umbellata]KAJ2624551.1 hypothetical protein GGI26_001470 [Coemansia sp. RSA 1358]KAJ2679481.1 hypothetical protein GGI25_001404 [Coemansia spiralis]